MRILVDRKGDVLEAHAVKAHPLLEAAAKNAAMRWKFKNNFGRGAKQK